MAKKKHKMRYAGLTGERGSFIVMFSHPWKKARFRKDAPGTFDLNLNEVFEILSNNPSVEWYDSEINGTSIVNISVSTPNCHSKYDPVLRFLSDHTPKRLNGSYWSPDMKIPDRDKRDYPKIPPQKLPGGRYA